MACEYGIFRISATFSDQTYVYPLHTGTRIIALAARLESDDSAPTRAMASNGGHVPPFVAFLFQPARHFMAERWFLGRPKRLERFPVRLHQMVKALRHR